MVEQTASLFASLWVKLRLKMCWIFCFILPILKSLETFDTKNISTTFDSENHLHLHTGLCGQSEGLKTCRTLNKPPQRCSDCTSRNSYLVESFFFVFFCKLFFLPPSNLMEVQVQKTLDHKHGDKAEVPPASQSEDVRWASGMKRMQSHLSCVSQFLQLPVAKHTRQRSAETFER